MSGGVVFAGIAPHPPLLVPTVGGTRIERVQASADALKEFSAQLVAARPDTIALVSPHSPGSMHSFSAFSAPQLSGDFHQFGARQVSLCFENDLALFELIKATAYDNNLPFEPIPEHCSLDHGVLVPMFYLHQAGWRGPLLSLCFSTLSIAMHIQFGRLLAEAAIGLGRRIAVVASADLSHYLSTDGPYQFEPCAHLFDEQICNAVKNQDLQAIVDIDQELRYMAGECGYRSILIAIGAVETATPQPRLLSYEGPFGVGYLVAILKDSQATSTI
ncbi:MAG: AmmeMemoRadiSam system protein B [Acidobacteriota bacterium]